MKFNLKEDLKKRCPLFEGLSDKELLEAAIDPINTYMYFLRQEVTEDAVRYVYDCPICGIEHEELLPLEQDFMYIGSCPADEDPYPEYTSMQTCAALMVQLKNKFGREPAGARLRMRYERGSDGYEVVCDFDYRYPESMVYALALEGELPERWSEAAIRTLEELTGQPYVDKDRWVRFWFESNVIWGDVSNREEWLHIKNTLKANDYQSDPLNCRASKTSDDAPRFGYYEEFTEELTLRDFFRNNGMKP